ncbi:MAG: hypothetical protein HKN72_17610 [Gemmatimonadetes bacterium]|nr:hypothetical protein [Gemmatimonadota bacterium]
MYGSPPKTFDELIAPFDPETRETAEWLRTLILESFPHLEEGIYGGVKLANALYSVDSPNSVVLGIQPTEGLVKLFIHDPEHLGRSSFKLEGRGKHMRHIKFTAPPDERRDELVELMRIPVERRS